MPRRQVLTRSGREGCPWQLEIIKVKNAGLRCCNRSPQRSSATGTLAVARQNKGRSLIYWLEGNIKELLVASVSWTHMLTLEMTRGWGTSADVPGEQLCVCEEANFTLFLSDMVFSTSAHTQMRIRTAMQKGASLEPCFLVALNPLVTRATARFDSVRNNNKSACSISCR